MSPSPAGVRRPSIDASAASGDPRRTIGPALSVRERLLLTCLAASPQGRSRCELLCLAYGVFSDDAALFETLRADLSQLRSKLEQALGRDPVVETKSGVLRLDRDACPIAS